MVAAVRGRQALIAAVIMGVLAAACLAVVAYAIISLEDRVLRLEQHTCQLEHTDRGIDRAIIKATGIHLNIPPPGSSCDG